MRNRMPSTRRIEIREAADTTALSKYENNRHAICSKYSFLRSKFPSRTLLDQFVMEAYFFFSRKKMSITR